MPNVYYNQISSTNHLAIDEKFDLAIGESKSWTFTAPDRCDFFNGWLRWGKPQDTGGKIDPVKDVRAIVTNSLGEVIIYDAKDPSTKQVFDAAGPAGTWGLEVVNDGTKNLKDVTAYMAMGRIE